MATTSTTSSSSSSKGKSNNNGGGLSPRMSSDRENNGMTTFKVPRSPTSPTSSTAARRANGNASNMLHPGDHHNNYASGSSNNMNNAGMMSPSSSALHLHHGGPSSSSPVSNAAMTIQQLQQHHQQQQLQPPRFRQQQQHDAPQYIANQHHTAYYNPASSSSSLSPATIPIPSTSNGPRSPYSSTTSNATLPSPRLSSFTNNPTIASMQSSSSSSSSAASSSKSPYMHAPPPSAKANANTSNTKTNAAVGGGGPSTNHSHQAHLSHYNNQSNHSHIHPIATSSSNSNTSSSTTRLPRPSETFTRELSNVLQHTFIPSILPSPEEYQTKEAARKYLEYLADRITPGAKLLPFGSQANGLALRNSDMDLCYISPPGKARKAPSELVELLGRMIEVEAPVFAVKMLSRARIPIIKLSPSPIYHLRKQEIDSQRQKEREEKEKLNQNSATAGSSTQANGVASTSSLQNLPNGTTAPSSSGTTIPQPNSQTIPSTSTSTQSQAQTQPQSQTPTPPPMPEYGLSCDIGFENRLALENTRLLLTYAMADPRLRTIVLFLKVWAKRRKINNSYLGTLSSYGYVLLVIHFLINVRRPPVLPNLQRLRPPGMTSMGQAEFDGRDIYFFDDLELLPRYWQSSNRDNVGELLIAFFHYYHKEFRYTFDVVSIRSEGGILSKAQKGWMNDQPMDGELLNGATPGKDAPVTVNRNAPRDLNRLCIEDPFQTDYNVARTVTVDGLFTIRGEIARATGILRGTRSDVNAVIAELLEEREDYLVQAPPPQTNRRRSAPSPRLQPSVLATHQDFRTWALANGVPHAQGGNVFAHQQFQGSSLLDDLNNQAGNGGLSAINAETLARYQQVSQALSQANLQQQQAQQQQALLANLPALLAANNLRNSGTSRSAPRRFHGHNYRGDVRQSGNGLSQQQQQQALLGQQMLSPQQQHQQIFGNNQQMMASMGHLQTPANKSNFSKSHSSGTHLARPPILERRSSWDGSAASDETRQQNFRGASSVSEAGVPDLGTTTAPTSPAMHSGHLPVFAARPMYQPGPASATSPTLSTTSVATAPAGSFSQYASSQNVDRQGRDYRSQRSGSSYQRGTSQASNSNQYSRGPRHQRDEQGIGLGTSIPMQAFPISVPAGQLPLAEGYPMNYQPSRADPDISGSSAVSLTSTSASLAASPVVHSSTAAGMSLNERDPIVQEDDGMPSPSSIRFGNFDAAFYSSEPTEMAGLGLFDGQSSTEDSPLSLVELPTLDDASIPEEVTLPPPVRLPPQQPAAFVASMKAAQRFRPQLADIPASPATKHMPSPGTQNTTAEGSSSRRPSLQSNRRRSAGDEAGLGLLDVTFFGKIPVSKDEGEREEALAALLKESNKDFRSSRSVSSSSSVSHLESFLADKEGGTGTESTAPSPAAAVDPPAWPAAKKGLAVSTSGKSRSEGGSAKSQPKSEAKQVKRSQR